MCSEEMAVMWAEMAGGVEMGVWPLLHRPLSLAHSAPAGMGWTPAAVEPLTPQGVWQWVWPGKHLADQPMAEGRTCLGSPFQIAELNLGDSEWNRDRVIEWSILGPAGVLLRGGSFQPGPSGSAWPASGSGRWGVAGSGVTR